MLEPAGRVFVTLKSGSASRPLAEPVLTSAAVLDGGTSASARSREMLDEDSETLE